MEQKTEALYLINGDRFLHLRENGAGVGFATYDCATGEPLESGQISKQNLPPDGRNAISAARNWYLFELSSDDRKAIQEVSLQHLDTIPQSGVRRRRIWDDPTIPRDDVRLINSHYDDLYRVPNHGVVQVDRSDGSSYTARVEHLDDYHFDMGEYGNVYHICQFGEMMERSGSTAYPEIQTQDEQGAWELGGKGYLAIQSCEDGWGCSMLPGWEWADCRWHRMLSAGQALRRNVPPDRPAGWRCPVQSRSAGRKRCSCPEWMQEPLRQGRSAAAERCSLPVRSARAAARAGSLRPQAPAWH